MILMDMINGREKREREGSDGRMSGSAYGPGNEIKGKAPNRLNCICHNC